MDGGNRTTAFYLILNNTIKVLSEDERIKIRSHPISLVVMYNLTGKGQRELFTRLNKCVKTTSGQLYAMSEEDSPLIQEVKLFIGDSKYPLRKRITSVFCDLSDHRECNGKKQLENSVAIISGALNGIECITTVFDRQERFVESMVPVDRQRIINMFDIVLRVFEEANAVLPLKGTREKKKQFTIGIYIGAILYDIHTQSTQIDVIVDKWKTYILMVRRRTNEAEYACVISGKKNTNSTNNLTVDKLKRISYKVEIFVREQRLVAVEDLKQIKHVYELKDDDTVDIMNEEDSDDDEDDA